MRALVYTDLQATDGHEKLFSDPTSPLQVWRVTRFYEDLFDIYTQNKCDCLWDLGDTTDDRNAIPVQTIHAVCTGLSRFPQSDLNIKLIGNHEQYLRNTEIHVGQMFAPYFHVVEGCYKFIEGGVNILACSYPADEAALVKWIDGNKSDRPTVILGHFQVAGCFTRGGQLLTGVRKTTLDWAKLCLLGHIHKPQHLGKTIHYVGSPFQQNWGESGERKRVAIVDLPSCDVQWIEMEGYPQYCEVNLTDFKEQCDGKTEDRFKVVLRSQEEASDFYTHPRAHQAEPVYDFDVTKQEAPEGSAEVVSDWSMSSVIQRFVRAHPISESGINISEAEMLVVGQEISTP